MENCGSFRGFGYIYIYIDYKKNYTETEIESVWFRQNYDSKLNFDHPILKINGPHLKKFCLV